MTICKEEKLMENNWKAWIPDHDLENKYFICKAVDDEDGLRLFLISKAIGIAAKEKKTIKPLFLLAWSNSFSF